MDIIYLHDLKIPCIVGVWEWERRIKQTVIIDIDLGTNIRAASSTDDLANALDYKAVANRLIDYVGDSKFQLVETLAEKVAETVLAEFNVSWVRVCINKKWAIRAASNVGVVIERGEKS